MYLFIYVITYSFIYLFFHFWEHVFLPSLGSIPDDKRNSAGYADLHGSSSSLNRMTGMINPNPAGTTGQYPPGSYPNPTYHGSHSSLPTSPSPALGAAPNHPAYQFSNPAAGGTTDTGPGTGPRTGRNSQSGSISSSIGDNSGRNSRLPGLYYNDVTV